MSGKRLGWWKMTIGKRKVQDGRKEIGILKPMFVSIIVHVLLRSYIPKMIHTKPKLNNGIG